MTHGYIYLAGPMRGIPYFNFPAFDRARDRLQDEGWSVRSPADMDREIGFDGMDYPVADEAPENFDMEDARRRDLEAIRNSRAIALLPGWTNSIGARAEKHYAEWCGKEVYLFDETRDGGLVDPDSDIARRDNQGKPELTYWMQVPNGMSTFVDVMEYGARKYERNNWKKGGKPDQEYFDAALRHLSAFLNGESHDPESRCSHLGHAVWNLLVVQELNYDRSHLCPRTND